MEVWSENCAPLVSGRVAIESLRARFQLRLIWTWYLFMMGIIFSLPRSVISRDISSGNSRNIFIFWVRLDKPSASNGCFILGTVQFPRVSGIDHSSMWGGALAWYTVLSSYWKIISNVIKQHFLESRRTDTLRYSFMLNTSLRKEKKASTFYSDVIFMPLWGNE